TLKSRLERGRALLRRRLARRGLVLPAAWLASLLAESLGEAALPAPLLPSTVKAATAFAAGPGAGALASPPARPPADGALGGWSGGPLKAAALILLAMLVCGGGTALGLAWTAKPGQPDSRAEPSVAQGPEAAEAAPVVPGAPTLGADWPQWRGPNRDGVVRGVSAPARWPKTLTEEWSVPGGPGAASPVVVGGSVYVFTRQKSDEFVLCLDLHSGRELWRSEPYPAPYRPGPGDGGQ